MMLWLAPVIALAQNPDDRAILTTIAAIHESPAAFHGKRVRVRGWIHACGRFSCRLHTYDPTVPATRGNSLSIEANPEFDLQVAGAPVEIVLHANVDARCLRDDAICFDRPPDLRRLALERILSVQDVPTETERR